MPLRSYGKASGQPLSPPGRLPIPPSAGAPAPSGRPLRGTARPSARGRAVPCRAVRLRLPACVYNFVLLPVVVRRRDVEVGGEQGDRLLGRAAAAAAAAAGGLGAGGSVASRRLLADGAGGPPLSLPSPLKGRLLGS